MISKEQVKYIAKLARLELTEKEIEKIQKNLVEILNYFNVLKEAPKPEKEELPTIKTSNLRHDEARDSQLSEKIFAAVPDKKDSYIKVKIILKWS